jgi:hypothetical protein
MSIELTQEFNQIVKHVEFFPYEWSSNLLAVCFTDSVKLFIYHDSSFRKEVRFCYFDNHIKYIFQFDFLQENEYNAFINQEPSVVKQRKLQLIGTVPFQQKIEQFTWSPKTSIASLKQNIKYLMNEKIDFIILKFKKPFFQVLQLVTVLKILCFVTSILIHNMNKFKAIINYQILN